MIWKHQVETIVTMKMNLTLCITVPIPDMVPGWKSRCEPLRCEPGAGKINLNRAIQRLGGKSITYSIGGVVIGQMLKNLLEQGCVFQSSLELETESFGS